MNKLIHIKNSTMTDKKIAVTAYCNGDKKSNDTGVSAYPD